MIDRLISILKTTSLKECAYDDSDRQGPFSGPSTVATAKKFKDVFVRPRRRIIHGRNHPGICFFPKPSVLNRMKINDLICSFLFLALAIVFTLRIPANFYSHGVNAREDILVDVVFVLVFVFGAVTRFRKKTSPPYGFGVKKRKDDSSRSKST